jgi:hypothetical protein
MADLLIWWPWVIPALLAGSFNLIVAYQKFYQACRSPFFNPWRSAGFWFWVFVQMFLPALFFWFYAKIPSKPTINQELYFSSVGVGFFFMILVNANSDLGFFNFPIDKVYAFLTKLAYDRIAVEQTGKWTRFEMLLIAELEGKFGTLDKGTMGLKRYFTNDLSFNSNESERQARLAECDRARTQPDPAKKLEAILAILLQIRRQDLPDRLLDFGCRSEFLQMHFPKKFLKSTRS